MEFTLATKYTWDWDKLFLTGWIGDVVPCWDPSAPPELPWASHPGPSWTLSPDVPDPESSNDEALITTQRVCLHACVVCISPN